MKAKKTAVITFRTPEEIRAELEFRAEKYGWTVSQFVEKTITNTITNELNTAEQFAKKALIKIENKEIKKFRELTQWAIEENQLSEVNLTVDIWKTIFEEIKSENK